MHCATYREALSARLDGEDEPVPADLVDRHLESCAGCRAFAERAATLRRSMTVRVATPTPDLTERIMADAPPPRRERWAARLSLGVVAVAQSTLAFAQLFGLADGLHGHEAGFMTGHLSNESVAWNLAIGVGLGWAALRTRAAAGQLPLFAGFVLVLTVVSVGDLVTSHVTAERLASHGLVVLGLALLLVVNRQHQRDDHPNPVHGQALPEEEPADTGAADERFGAPRHKTGRGRRPASRRVA